MEELLIGEENSKSLSVGKTPIPTLIEFMTAEQLEKVTLPKFASGEIMPFT